MLKNVRTISKPPRGKYEFRRGYDLSSDIKVYSVYDQDWQTLVDENLTHLFNGDQSEFEQAKARRRANGRKQNAEASTNVSRNSG